MLLIGTVEFPCMVVFHLLHIGVRPLNLGIQIIYLLVQLGILFLQSVHLVAAKKRVHSVEYTSGSLRSGVLQFFRLSLRLGFQPRLLTLGKEHASMSLLSLNRSLDTGKVFLCLFRLGYHQSCLFLFFQQLSNVSL